MATMTRQSEARATIEARLRAHLKEKAQEKEIEDATRADHRADYERRLREPWPVVKRAEQKP